MPEEQRPIELHGALDDMVADCSNRTRATPEKRDILARVEHEPVTTWAAEGGTQAQPARRPGRECRVAGDTAPDSRGAGFGRISVAAPISPTTRGARTSRYARTGRQTSTTRNDEPEG
jgi:hypothetical protein